MRIVISFNFGWFINGGGKIQGWRCEVNLEKLSSVFVGGAPFGPALAPSCTPSSFWLRNSSSAGPDLPSHGADV